MRLKGFCKGATKKSHLIKCHINNISYGVDPATNEAPDITCKQSQTWEFFQDAPSSKEKVLRFSVLTWESVKNAQY